MHRVSSKVGQWQQTGWIDRHVCWWYQHSGVKLCSGFLVFFVANLLEKQEHAGTIHDSFTIGQLLPMPADTFFLGVQKGAPHPMGGSLNMGQWQFYGRMVIEPLDLGVAFFQSKPFVASAAGFSLAAEGHSRLGTAHQIRCDWFTVRITLVHREIEHEQIHPSCKNGNCWFLKTL